MITKTFDVSLDMKRSSSRDFEVVEGDSGNVIRVELTDDGEPVDLTGRLVVAVFALPDGTTVEQDTTEGSVTIEDNVATIALKTGSAKPGTINCELQVYSGTDNTILITSAQFNFRCRRSIVNADTIEATDQYPLLTALMAETAALHESIEVGEAARAAAEALRDGAEQQRQTEEAARHTAEAGRVAAEMLRDEKVGEVYAAFTAGELKGDKGDKGEKGDKGDKGDPGSYETHAHGNLTNGGAIGTAAGKLVVTGAGGLLTAGRTLAVGATEPSEMAASLGEGDVYIYCPTMAG